MTGVRIELGDPQGQLLAECGMPKIRRKDIALTYAFALRSADRVNWPVVNRAIIDRWSVSGLEWIKREAFKKAGADQ